MSEKISWETVMVYNILKNLVYTGTLVSRKMKSCGVGSKKRVVNEPIIVEGTHEALSARKTLSLLRRSFEAEDGIPRASSMTIRSRDSSAAVTVNVL